MDQVGLIVSKITEEGFLLFEMSGGVDPRVLPGGRVRITGYDGKVYPGVIGGVADTFDDGAAAVPMEKMFIDIGMSAEEAVKCIRPGDPVYFHTKAKMLTDKNLTGNALDDRACFTCILYALEQLVQEDRWPDCDIIVAGASAEEIRGKGVFGIGYSLQPDLAVAVDVCHAETYDVGKLDGVHPVGSGPSIAVGAMGRVDFAEKLMAACDEKKIPYSIDPNVGESWTDADCYYEAGTGIPTMLVSLPLRYMHTPTEQMFMDDGVNTGKALAELIAAFPQWKKEEGGDLL
jgi:endoglucanase